MEKLAEIDGVQQQLRSGHRPKHVDVALAGDALVMVFQDALTPAEQELSQDPDAASQLQAFHRELFLSSTKTMNTEIARVTGRSVRETATETGTATGALTCSPTAGVMVQVYMLNPESNSETGEQWEQDDAIERAEDEGMRVTPQQYE